MKLFSLKENKLGMTLVEMVISLVILGILMSSTMGMIISSNNIFISTSKSAIDKQVGNYAFDFIEKALRYTTHMSIYDQSKASQGTDIQSVSLNVTDSANNAGTLMYKRADGSDPFNLYDESFYGGRSIQYSVHKVGNKNKHVKLKLTVFRDGRAVYSRESVVKCLNLNLVAVGDGANPLVDQSSADAVNQFITFSVDEKLLSGGKNAFSLEYKVAEYIAKYNKIQNDYVNDINKAYNKYINNEYNAEENPGIRGTEDLYNKRITSDSFATRLDKVTNIIFGNGSDYTVYDKDNIDNCVNLRAEYQNRINNLLKFTLKGSNGGQFTEGSITNGVIAGTSYKLHNGDEFYGVVATKEELFTGFMLNYYDKDKDGVITKAEYPQFEGDSFFQGTSMGNYIKNTTDNQMVIMTYFKDNVSNDNYKALVVKENADVYSFSGEYAEAEGSTSVTLSNSITDPASGFGTNRYPATLDQNTTYIYWSDQSYYMPGATRATSITNYLTAIGAKAINAGADSGYYNTNANVSYTVPDENGLTAGWYYVRASYLTLGGTMYVYNVFYLPAQENHTKAIANGKNITFTFDNNGNRITGNARLNKIVYDQADYSMQTSGAEFKTQVTYKTFTAHQYDDYVLYGVDWNSWFNATPQGILNQVMTGISNFINTIFGRTVNKNITSISASNAVQSLGNIGQHNVNTNNGQVASYNLAWVVYSPKRGTWYYVPAQSTRISGVVSSIGWMSNKDQPTPLDVDLDKGTWNSSSAMVSDIEKRKMSSTFFFDIIDTTSDVMWVALPTGNTINPKDVID